jgi:hypothetical protein
MAVLLSRMDGAHTQALRTAGTWSKKKMKLILVMTHCLGLGSFSVSFFSCRKTAGEPRVGGVLYVLKLFCVKWEC